MTSRSDRIHSRLTPIEPASERLPYWTRSTNPIVRRHLGLYWRTLPPEVRPILWGLAGWSVFLILGTWLFPSMLYFALIFLIVSMIVIPVMTVWYAKVMFDVATQSSDIMQAEKRNNTLQLLMATPMSLEQILLGKVAASIWRRMEDWTLISYCVAYVAPPIFFLQFTQAWQSQAHPLALPIAVMGGTAVSLLRLVLEPLMLGMVGVFLGAVVPYRSTAISLSVAFGVAYVAFFWFIGQLPFLRGGVLNRVTIAPNYGLIVLVDFVLPILLPMLIILISLRLTRYALLRENTR
jgi:hypothetical protein